MELITAKEAHKYVIDHNEKIYNKQKEQISLMIDKAIKEGKFSINWRDDLCDRIIITLKEYGYTIHTYPIHDDEYYEISW